MSISQVQVALSRELLSKDLEPLERDFYRRALRGVREAKNSGDSVTAELLLRSLRLLFLLRVQKALHMISEERGVPPDLPDEEREAIECIRRILLSFENDASQPLEAARSSTPVSVQGAQAPSAEPLSTAARDLVLVSFLKHCPRIVEEGIGMGPFKRGDVARVPRKVAEELAKQGYVEVLP